MTTSQGRVERRLTATLDTPDDRDAIGNEIHSTDGAKDYGYQAALVGGATVFGWATPAILEALGDGWLNRGWAEAAFRRPTYPGDDLTVVVEPSEDGDGAFDLHITGEDGHDRVSGRVGLGDAAWLDELAVTPRHEAEPAQDKHPLLTMAVVPIGQELRAFGEAPSPEDAVEFAKFRGRATEQAFLETPAPRLHPGWVSARPIYALHHSYDYAPGIHAKSHIQFLRPARLDTGLVTTSTFREAYERKGHQYAVIDCSTYDGEGHELIRQRHTNIFGVAKRPAGDR